MTMLNHSKMMQQSDSKLSQHLQEDQAPSDRKIMRQKRKHGGKEPNSVNQFPLIQSSLEPFEESSNSFYIYIVHSKSASGPLKWNVVQWGDLSTRWGPSTSFTDLLQISTNLHDDDDDDDDDDDEHGLQSASTLSVTKKKLVLHCLPKTASTTLREACRHEFRSKCSASALPVDKGGFAFGYRNITNFFMAINECKDMNHFCVQGGSLEMDIMNYKVNDGDDDNNDREHYHFIHMVPFRQFNEWVDSAISHIFFIDKQCNRIEKVLNECLGLRELYMELYTKSVLSTLIGMALLMPNRKDMHHIVLYNYKDTESILSQVSNYFSMEPLPRVNQKYKVKSSNETTCPDTIAKKFHNCHDRTLMQSNVVTNFTAEKERRASNHKQLISIIRSSRKNGY